MKTIKSIGKNIMGGLLAIGIMFGVSALANDSIDDMNNVNEIEGVECESEMKIVYQGSKIDHIKILKGGNVNVN